MSERFVDRLAGSARGGQSGPRLAAAPAILRTGWPELPTPPLPSAEAALVRVGAAWESDEPSRGATAAPRPQAFGTEADPGPGHRASREARSEAGERPRPAVNEAPIHLNGPVRPRALEPPTAASAPGRPASGPPLLAVAPVPRTTSTALAPIVVEARPSRLASARTAVDIAGRGREELAQSATLGWRPPATLEPPRPAAQPAAKRGADARSEEPSGARPAESSAVTPARRLPPEREPQPIQAAPAPRPALAAPPLGPEASAQRDARAGPDVAEPAPVEVVVRIGRIDVRTTAPAPPPPVARSAPFRPHLSLDDYLARRQRGER